LQSAEDRALKERLELCVERVSDSDFGVVLAALQMLRKEIKEATRYVAFECITQLATCCTTDVPKLTIVLLLFVFGFIYAKN
jgi:hypothetical protein